VFGLTLTFKLNRIQSYQLLEEYFQPKKAVEDKIKQGGFGIFKQAEYELVADFFHPFNDYIQEISIGDGQVCQVLGIDTTRMTVTLDNVNEMIGFLLSFGSRVVVREPFQIRMLIRDEVERMQRVYQKK